MLFNNKLTTAELNAVPMWNITSNSSEPCSVHLDYYNDEHVTVLTGKQFEMCGVEVTSSKRAAIMIRIPLRSSVDNFMYAVRQGELLTNRNRYVVIEGDEPCVSQLFHQQFQLFLQGNISIFISEISNHSLSIRSEVIDQARNESKVSQTKLCPISEFNHTLSCITNSTQGCSFDFPLHCNATLRTKSVEFKCPSDSFITSYKALVMYPTNIHELNLTSHRIVQVYGRPFHRFEALHTIRLDYNILSTLPPEIFQNLSTLSLLSLKGNFLHTLDDATFRGLNRLRYLSLNDNNLNTLQQGCFRKLFNLTKLYLRDNEFVYLNENLFSDLMSLTTLMFHRSELQMLPNGLFQGLMNLETLYLCQNKIKYIPIGLFKGLTNLLDLRLQGNQIISLDGDLFNETSKLLFLALGNNNLTGLQNRLFKGLTNLETLYLHQNKLKDLPIGLFKGLNNLLDLSLHNNQIISLDSNLFNETSKLLFLSLGNNNLTDLPNRLFKGLTNLKTLHLYQNKLKDLPIGLFKGLNNLLDLILFNNQVISLDSNIFNETSKLVYLSLGNNNLADLPNRLFKGLTSLETLHLYQNKLKDLPIGLFIGLNNLLDLKLHDNQIISLDSNLFNETSKLVYLSLENNNLADLPNRLFTGLTNLETLYLHQNKLQYLPSGLFKGLNNLLDLRLGSNQIISLDGNSFNETSKLVVLSFRNNSLTCLPNRLFRGLTNLSTLGLYQNNLKALPKQLLLGLKKLKQLYLYYNHLQSLHSTLFQDLANLEVLDLAGNQLVELKSTLFLGLKNIQILDLNKNNLTNLAYKTFKGLRTLQLLFLQFNQLSLLEHNIFQDTVNLSYLDLSGNKLRNIPNINNVNRLSFINLRDNILSKISRTTFLDLPNQTEIIVSQTEICECYVPSNAICTALDVRSPYLTCDRLLSDKTLVVVMWLIGINALGGNVFVLCLRKIKHSKNKVGSRQSDTNIIQSFLLSNLALSDLLMGIYMLLIASADIYFGDNFPMQAETWRSGITCRIAGTISILSSEASVFFVTLISIERFLNIRYPFSQHKLSKTSSRVIVTLLWIISLILGLVPSSLAGRNYTFYDNSHVCIGLPLTLIEMFTKNVSQEKVSGHGGTTFLYFKYMVQSESQGKVPGIYFATAMFLGLNCICYWIILICYVEIVRLVYKSSKRTGIDNEMKKQVRMTVKVAAIVLTDFLCWFPIILLGILVQARVLTLPPSVYAWCVTFVLPINSAINPYLYTISQLISTYRNEVRSTNPSNTKKKT